MECALCGLAITDFDVRVHQLTLHPGRSMAICAPCQERFAQWQRDLNLHLFPTRLAKRYRDGRAAGQQRRST